MYIHMYLNKLTIDKIYYFINDNISNINYIEKYKMLKKNNLIIHKTFLDNIIEIEEYILNLQNTDELDDKRKSIISIINNHSNYFISLDILDIVLNLKNILFKKNILVKHEIIKSLKNGESYITVKNINFNDSFFYIFKNIEICLFILKHSIPSKDTDNILNSNINTIKNILFYKNIFYTSFYNDIHRKIIGLNINKYKICLLLLGELFGIYNGKDISTSIFNIHAFKTSETKNTYKQFKINLNELYKTYDDEIIILKDKYNINLTNIIQKYVLYNTNKYLLTLGILQNVINLHKYVRIEYNKL
jgi:hypothetical protein